MGLFAFKKEARITERADFLRIGSQGRKVRTRHFLILFESNGLERSRMGITASRKIGGAVKRNRVKRLVREFFRLTHQRFTSTVDLVFIAGRGSPDLGFEEVSAEFLRGLRQAGLIDDSPRKGAQ